MKLPAIKPETLDACMSTLDTLRTSFPNRRDDELLLWALSALIEHSKELETLCKNQGQALDDAKPALNALSAFLKMVKVS